MPFFFAEYLLPSSCLPLSQPTLTTFPVLILDQNETINISINVNACNFYRVT